MKMMKEGFDFIADYADYADYADQKEHFSEEKNFPISVIFWSLAFFEKMRMQSFTIISKQVLAGIGP